MALAATTRRPLHQIEFYTFTILAFLAKSYLLVRLPYREWPVNTAMTLALIAAFYLFFRFRQGLVAPPVILFCLAAAVGVDVLGNYLGLYGQPFGPFPDYDDFAHVTASGFSLVPTIWLIRSATSRMGFNLPMNFLAFISVTVAFAFAAYYEILEHWDEVFWGGKRIWTTTDTVVDLQYDLAGIIIFALASVMVLRLVGREHLPESLG